jgi:hypothetical protein
MGKLVGWTLAAIGATLLVLTVSGPAQAGTVVPFQVYNNDEGADLTGTDWSLEVFDLGSGKGEFVISNDSTVACDIKTVFVEKGLDEIIGNLVYSAAHSSGGVDFGEAQNGSSPGGGLDPAWTGKMFLAKRDGGSDGIDKGEWAAFTFDFISGRTIDHLLAVLPNNGTNTGRIVVHVGSLNGTPDKSVWAVTVPVPPAAWMGLGLLASIGVLRQVRRRRAAGR